MLRLSRYLKPYLGLVLLAIGLLFGQAMADLTLPNYMSEIVNNGIQQGGIESAVPDAVRKSQMDKAFLFMTGDEKNQVLEHYTLIESTSADAASLAKTYPALQNESIYVLNSIDDATRTALTPILGKSLLTVYTSQEVIQDPSKAALMGAGAGFDLSQIPAGVDVFTMLSNLPAEQLQKMTTAVDSRFASMDNKMIIQAAARRHQANTKHSGWTPTASNPITSCGSA